MPELASDEPRETRTSRDQQREDTRLRVFEAALFVFRADGVEAARIDDIVARAGVSRGTFYFHFPTKDDVLAELLRLSSLRVAAAVLAVPSAASVSVLMDTVAGAIAAEWHEDAGIFPDVARVALKFSAGQPPTAVRSARDCVADRFVIAGAAGQLTPLAPADTLSDLFLINQFAVALAWSSRPDVPLEVALKGAAALFLYGAGKF